MFCFFIVSNSTQLTYFDHLSISNLQRDRINYPSDDNSRCLFYGFNDPQKSEVPTYVIFSYKLRLQPNHGYPIRWLTRVGGHREYLLWLPPESGIISYFDELIYSKSTLSVLLEFLLQGEIDHLHSLSTADGEFNTQPVGFYPRETLMLRTLDGTSPRSDISYCTVMIRSCNDGVIHPSMPMHIFSLNYSSSTRLGNGERRISWIFSNKKGVFVLTTWAALLLGMLHSPSIAFSPSNVSLLTNSDHFLPTPGGGKVKLVLPMT